MFGSDFETMISEHMAWLWIKFINTSCEIACISGNVMTDKSTLVQVMACCLKTVSHYLSQYWSDLCRHMALPGHNVYEFFCQILCDSWEKELELGVGIITHTTSHSNTNVNLKSGHDSDLEVSRIKHAQCLLVKWLLVLEQVWSWYKRYAKITQHWRTKRKKNNTPASTTQI